MPPVEIGQKNRFESVGGHQLAIVLATRAENASILEIDETKMKTVVGNIRMCYCGIRRRRGPLVGAHLGPIWKCLGPIWDPFYSGPIWGPILFIWGPFGSHLGAHFYLGPFGPIWGRRHGALARYIFPWVRWDWGLLQNREFVRRLRSWRLERAARAQM